MRSKPFSLFCSRHPGQQKQSLVSADGKPPVYYCPLCQEEAEEKKAALTEAFRRVIRSA